MKEESTPRLIPLGKLNQSFQRCLEINGGYVETGETMRLVLPPIQQGYGDAQVDDYGRCSARRYYPWQTGLQLHLYARFSHPAGKLLGTAGFGFWNAPFGDPTVPWPALPQAAWFFYASAPGDLPLAPDGSGRGWFASTLDATTWQAWGMAPLAPLVLLLNHIPGLRRHLWPIVRRRLGISYVPLEADLTEWHRYELQWQIKRCIFRVDGRVVLSTSFSPRGPLGFVCWLDNQYLVATNKGRFGWGTLSTAETQWLEVKELRIMKDEL